MSQQPTGQGKARGRARGRARGQQPTEQGAPVQTQQQPGPIPQRNVPPVVQQPAPRAAYRGAERPGGLQVRQGEQEQQLAEGVTELSLGGNNNNGKKNVGRGQLRGRREIGKIYQSRPEQVVSKMGTTGVKIKVLTNYYEFKKNAKWSLMQYHVDFSIEEDRTYVKKALVRNHRQFIKSNYIYDGTCMFTTERFPQKETKVEGKTEEGTVYQITFTYIKELHHFDSQYIQILNIILRKCQEDLGLKLVGRDFYDPKGELAVPQHKLVIWPGFTTSIRHHENAILMNVDVSHKIIRHETVLDVLNDMRNKNKQDDFIFGAIVMTKYNSKTYKIDFVDRSLRPSCTFPLRDGKQITYNDYFKNKYQLKIRDQNQPLLKSIAKERDRRRGDDTAIILIPELCTMTGISDEMRNNFHTMKDLAAFTKPNPMKRVNTLQTFNNNLRSNQKVQENLKSWNLEISPNLIEVNCHLAADEKINQGALNDNRRSFNYNKPEADWTKFSRDRRLNEPMTVKNWALLYLSSCLNETRAFLVNLQQVAPAMGMSFTDPKKISLEGETVAAYCAAMRKAKGCEFVMLVLGNNRSDRYGSIKKEICNSYGIPSQFMLRKTILKGNKSIATKVAIQINCKLGGEPWNVDLPMKAMYVGFDVHHHSRQKGASFGATVASFNLKATKYFGTVNVHRNNEELSNNFYQSIKASMANFYRINGVIPPYIFIFRDGVGDSQVEYVKEIEIKAIRDMLTESYPENRPKLVFIVVSKRINTRIFSLDGRNTVRNALPGTVVDNTITLPERYDFFLVSQAVREGTVSPTSYNIIENESGLSPDHMQRLAYKMCHLYFNWQGTVRTPAPCMYAHKLAFMSGTATHDKVHPNLENRLWYL